jgi:hypothetical protein
MATQVSGSFGGTSSGDEVFVSFTCTLAGTTCTGVVAIHDRPRECSNFEDTGGTVTITGLDLTAAHGLAGNISITHTNSQSQPNAAGICSYIPQAPRTNVFPYTGQWDGVGRGTFVLEGVDDDNAPFRWNGIFSADVPGTPAVFEMRVTGSVTATVANIQADIQYRPQDVGTNASVYVFALAPATLVRGASAPNDVPGMMAKGAKADPPVACVLAQLNASGQLQQVSASGMQAYVTGVLSSQGQAVTVLNGVATAQIAGATFFVGYGATSGAMLDNGVNRNVVTAPAAQTCQPQPPQTGWWWNTTQGGRGFSMEVRGNTIFFASYLYDNAGRPVWLAASGPTSLDGSLFSGRLIGFSGGQTLDGAWRARGPAVDNGAVTLSFNDASHGTLVWPGGSVAIERFDIAAVGGHSLAPLANQPESGWWWNPQEDGRGFFLEWQGANAFVAGYMYDAAGIPIWYASLAATPNPRLFEGNWTQYAHGQTLTGPYQAPGVAISNVSPVTITFTGADSAVMTLPGGRATAITRFRF